MNVLSKIKSSGFSITINQLGELIVSPASKLTDMQRQFIKENKSEIIAELKANDIIQSLQVTCYTPAGDKMIVKAKNKTHAEFLIKMNPKQHHRGCNASKS